MVLPRIGFVGLGVMGIPMLGHLLAGGHAVCAFDASFEAIARAKAAHPRVRAADSPRALGAHADVVITMLPDGDIVNKALLGPEGVACGLAPGAIVIDTSSSDPQRTRETAAALAATGIAMVDAPVSGAQWGAEAAALVFMVGGDTGDIERVRPLLGLMGREIHHVGPLGAGHTMKCINNTITAATFLATAEGLALGVRNGLDPAAMNAVLNRSTGASWITENHIGQRILSGSFDDPFRLALMLKDIGIARAIAARLDMPMPLSTLVGEIYRIANREAGPLASVSELVRHVERISGCEIGPPH